jgi:hypothetical protein
VEQVLRRAGWYPGRILEGTELEKWYAFKYECNPDYHRIIPSALVVLREFGGLFVELGIPDSTGYQTCLWIDPLMTLGLHEETWGIFKWLLEESLFPLGITGNNEDDVLFITGSGRVFCATYDGDKPILLAGSNFDEALNSLIAGLMPVRVQIENKEAPELFSHHSRGHRNCFFHQSACAVLAFLER